MTSPDDAFASLFGDRRGSGRPDPQPPSAAPPGLMRWWTHREEVDRTHMDLRRWLDDRYYEGWRTMSLEAVSTAGGAVQWHIVVHGKRTRRRRRALWPAEYWWLLRAWPEELRMLGPRTGLLVKD